VNNRSGRMRFGCFKSPESNSFDSSWIEHWSAVAWLVIWHRIISSPVKFASTKAGRRLDCVRSEKGKGRTTTSPLQIFLGAILLRCEPIFAQRPLGKHGALVHIPASQQLQKSKYSLYILFRGVARRTVDDSRLLTHPILSIAAVVNS
jgi:hypothetical protein